jgi:hypothetical protein
LLEVDYDEATEPVGQGRHRPRSSSAKVVIGMANAMHRPGVMATGTHERHIGKRPVSAVVPISGAQSLRYANTRIQSAIASGCLQPEA